MEDSTAHCDGSFAIESPKSSLVVRGGADASTPSSTLTVNCSESLEKENGSSTTETPKKSSRSSLGGISYVQMIHEGIVTLKDAKGSSRIAISKWIQATYPQTVGPYLTTRLSQAFKSGESKGRFVKIRNSYKVSSAFKTAEKKKIANAKKKKADAKKNKAKAVSTNAAAAKLKPLNLSEVQVKNAAKLAELEAAGTLPQEELEKAKRNMKRREDVVRKKEEEERMAKEKADILRKRRFPMEDTKLHGEDMQLGISTKLPPRPTLPFVWHLTAKDGVTKISSIHQTASRVDHLENGSHGLIPDLLQVYHFWRGDVKFALKDDDQLVPDFSLQNLIYATNEILQGNAKKNHLLPPLITHLFCASLSVLLNMSEQTHLDLSPTLKNLFKDMQSISSVLTPASWADVCSLYIDAMQRFYSTEASFIDVLPALSTDMNFLLSRTDTPQLPMTPALMNKKQPGSANHSGDEIPTAVEEYHSLPTFYSAYLGNSSSALSRAYFRLLKSDPWILSAEELLALLRALTDDILSFNRSVAENMSKRDEEMQELTRNKRAADAQFRKARLAFEGPVKKQPSTKKVENNDEAIEGRNGETQKDINTNDEPTKDDILKEDEFKPTITKKQFESAKKAQEKASLAFEKGIRKLVSRTFPVGYDRNHNAVYCFRHDPEVLYVEEFRPAGGTSFATSIPDKFLPPRSTWHIIHKTSLFDLFVESLDPRGKRENDLIEELLGPSGPHQSLRRFLDDDVKAKIIANARRKEMESHKKKLEHAKMKCDEDIGRRSGRLAGQAEVELLQLEEEIEAIRRSQAGDNSNSVAVDNDLLTGRDLMRKFDAADGVETRRVREKKESNRALRTSFQCSKLICSGNIDGTGIVGMIVADLFQLEEHCEKLVPCDGVHRSDWIRKLENSVVAWNDLVTANGTTPSRASIGSSASKRRRMDSPVGSSPTASSASISLNSILSSLKPPILELSSRIASLLNLQVSRRDGEIAEENISVDGSDDADSSENERIEQQWKKTVHLIRLTSTRRHVQIRQLLVEALAAARKAHLSSIEAELRSALLLYRPNAAGECKIAAIQVLEDHGGYEQEVDDAVSDNDDEDLSEDLSEGKETSIALPTLLASDASVISASLGSTSEDATRDDWVAAVKACKTFARLSSLTTGLFQSATKKMAKLEEEKALFSEALRKWNKDKEKRLKVKNGQPLKEFEGPSEVWTDVEVSNDLCMAKTENFPWWPAKKCTAKDPAEADQLAQVDRCLVSLLGEMGSLRVVKNECLQSFTGEAIYDDDFSETKKEMRNQLDEFLTMGRRLERGLTKETRRSTKGLRCGRRV